MRATVARSIKSRTQRFPSSVLINEEGHGAQ